MGKRVGSYNNPTTGEEDWLEPETIDMVVLLPKMVTLVGDVNQSAMDFKLEATKDESNIALIAEYTLKSMKYSSEPILMPSEEFADKFKDIIYADKCLDDADFIKDAKDKACQSLTQKLMDNNVLIGGMRFIGFGYVYADTDKVMTFESIDFDYRVESDEKIYTAVIGTCVSQASLNNLETPKITLWTGTHQIELLNPEVTEAKEGKLKEYVLKISNINIVPETTMPKHTVYNNPNFQDEDFIDTFIEDRKTLLDDISGNDSELDDRFSDLF